MYGFLRYRVWDVMTRNPVTISHSTPLREVGELLERHGFNALPVVDGQGLLIGLVTKLDFLKAFAFSAESIVPRYEEILSRPAHTVMTREPQTVDASLPLTRVLEELVATRLKSFPVVDGKRLIGIIAREDVMHAVQRAAAGKGPEERS